MQTADLAPTVAWKINDMLSVGVGLDENNTSMRNL